MYLFKVHFRNPYESPKALATYSLLCVGVPEVSVSVTLFSSGLSTECLAVDHLGDNSC